MKLLYYLIAALLFILQVCIIINSESEEEDHNGRCYSFAGSVYEAINSRGKENSICTKVLNVTKSAPLNDSSTVTTSDSDLNKSSSIAEDIPSFSEWTKIQLEKKPEERSKVNNITRQQQQQQQDNGKNFASPDCGAKVLNTNPEAQNPSGFLSSSLDEYTLNRCGVNIHFTVELCEPLKLEKISLGNLELFSSSPKSFELYLSDRYPSRDWIKFGPYEAPDQRNIHNFIVTSPNTNNSLTTTTSFFGKYIKIQMLSHWGNEHYCPLTLVKIFGKSEYEVLESENLNDEEEEIPNQTAASVGGGGSILLPVLDEKVEKPQESVIIVDEKKEKEKEVVKPKEEKKSSVFNSATDVLKGLVQKVLSGKQDQHQPTKVERTICISTTQCVPQNSVSNSSFIQAHLNCNYRALQRILNLSKWCGWDYCHGIFYSSSIGTPSQIEGFFASFQKVNFLEAACHQHKPLKTCPIENHDDNSSNTFNFTDIPPQIVQEIPKDETTAADGLISTTTPETPESDSAKVESVIQPPPPMEQSDELPNIMKESVIVRLTNRIKTLERNQSLSSGYLEELSRRFKKQNEEYNFMSEITKKNINSTNLRFKHMEESFSRRDKASQRNISILRDKVSDLELQRGILFFFVIFQFICVILCIQRIKSHVSERVAYMERELFKNEKHRQNNNPRKRTALEFNEENLIPKLNLKKKKKKTKNNNNNNGESHSNNGSHNFLQINSRPPVKSSSDTKISDFGEVGVKKVNSNNNFSYKRDLSMEFNSRSLEKLSTTSSSNSSSNNNNNNNNNKKMDLLNSESFKSEFNSSNSDNTIKIGNNSNNKSTTTNNTNDYDTLSTTGSIKKKKGIKFKNLMQIFDHNK